MRQQSPRNDRTRPARARGGPLAMASLPLLLLLLTGAAAVAAEDPCRGVQHCRNLGPFTATAVAVTVTRQDRVTAYQGVRTTVRFTNVGDRPLILGYRDHTSAVSDDKGLVYRWSGKAYGIGVVSRGAADPQFRLAPGETREAAFDGVLQYASRREAPGSVFTHDITIVELAVLDGQHVRELRDHTVGFSGLTASAGYAAVPAAAAGLGPATPDRGAPAKPADALRAFDNLANAIKGAKR